MVPESASRNVSANSSSTTSRLEAARADVAEAEKNLATQVASDHEDPVKTLAEELKTLADATKVLQEGTRGAGGQTYSRFQESSSVDWESRDRNLLGTVEQIPDFLAPEMVEQLVKLPTTVSENRIQERTVEHIAADTPVPQVVEE